MKKNTPGKDAEQLSQLRRTKIIATLGPATDKPAIIENLINKGVNVFRLNMSHGSHEHHRILVSRIRRAEKKLGKHVAIMVDLCGPKIRVNRFENGVINLEEGKTVTITSQQTLGKPGFISSSYKRLHKDIKPGERIFLDDGNLELVARKINGNEIICKVNYGGPLKNNKGMNLPDSTLQVTSFTSKDKKDAEFAIELDIDFIALSFVRNKKDILKLQRFLDKYQSDIKIISKIEKQEAIDNIHDILDVSYAIMIARGDLGIEVPAERVPLMQHELINISRSHDVPVIVATQMLESMMGSSRPTRAEVGDVANAAILGADAVMLSGETAIGSYPVQAVQAMDRILREIEQSQSKKHTFGKNLKNLRHGEFSVREAVARAVLKLATDLNLKGIIIPTTTGTTARIIAAARPTAPCIGICMQDRINRRLALHWGVIPVQVNEPDTHDWRHLCEKINHKHKFIKKGNTVLLVAGFNDDPAINEPVIKILTV